MGAKIDNALLKIFGKGKVYKRTSDGFDKFKNRRLGLLKKIMDSSAKKSRAESMLNNGKQISGYQFYTLKDEHKNALRDLPKYEAAFKEGIPEYYENVRLLEEVRNSRLKDIKRAGATGIVGTGAIYGGHKMLGHKKEAGQKINNVLLKLFGRGKRLNVLDARRDKRISDLLKAHDDVMTSKGNIVANELLATPSESTIKKLENIRTLREQHRDDVKRMYDSILPEISHEEAKRLKKIKKGVAVAGATGVVGTGAIYGGHKMLGHKKEAGQKINNALLKLFGKGKTVKQRELRVLQGKLELVDAQHSAAEAKKLLDDANRGLHFREPLHKIEDRYTDRSQYVKAIDSVINGLRQPRLDMAIEERANSIKKGLAVAGATGVVGTGAIYGGHKMLGHKKEAELALQKLGEAYYIHKKNIERAELAKQAVEYLHEKGVLTDDLKKCCA